MHSVMKLLLFIASTCCLTGASFDVVANLQATSHGEDLGSLAHASDCRVVASLRSALEVGGAELEKHTSLDMGTCGFDPVDAQLIADVLQNPHGRLNKLVLDGRLLPVGDLVLILDASQARGTLKRLKVNECHLGSDGGAALLDFFKTINSTELSTVEFQDNDVGFGICQDLLDWGDKLGVRLNLDGNPLVSELGNAITHGIGELLALAGTVMMARRMRGKPSHYQWSLMTYCASLDVMFLMSLLHHSFFDLGIVVTHIFLVLDESAVFLVIVGTFTPLLAILFHGRTWAVVLHVIMCISAVCGIAVNFLSGTWTPWVRMPLFGAMGWSAVVCLYPIAKKIGKRGAWLLLLGGLFYSLGVFFDMRRRWFLSIPDHTTWHVLVVFGAVVHYQLIYQQVATYVEEPEQSSEPSILKNSISELLSENELDRPSSGKDANGPLNTSDFSQWSSETMV